MAESTFVRCEECTYENLAQHSFCGMCGAKLPPRRQAVTAATQPEPRPAPPTRQQPAQAPQAPARQMAISRPSLLGLAPEPTESERDRVDYLLEDEPDSSHSRGWLIALALALALGGLGWYWRTDIRGWLARAPQNTVADANQVVSAAPPTASTPETASSSAANPSPVTAPPTAGSTVASTSPASTAVPTPQDNQATPPATAGAPLPQPATPPAQAVTDAVARAPETKDETASDAGASSAITPRVAPSLAPRPVKTTIERRAPVTDISVDALETQGENYLYGHGVPADCERAGKSLLTAAARSSAKAQSVLGTMYATGHCVTRDVPTAYRWFAKALHQDPSNVRVQRDLEVLWAQMTPEEQQVAMKSEP